LSDLGCDQKRIFLVDTDEAFGDVLQGVLGNSYILSQHASVDGAVAQLASHELSVILLNVDLPDGGQPNDAACALSRVISERMAEIPVMAYGWDKPRQ